ncbi:hypothetical protein KQX54_002964 [Cotesia glomerata]|uniref:Uncharacterized protein n=1 Tax=Cotesia glomerata TaxID=32391 RepID=A0AAV7ICE4_COTGL|nr:hypothetical protein KQX54_002964 [Cotesia glomerata]
MKAPGDGRLHSCLGFQRAGAMMPPRVRQEGTFRSRRRAGNPGGLPFMTMRGPPWHAKKRFRGGPPMLRCSCTLPI